MREHSAAAPTALIDRDVHRVVQPRIARSATLLASIRGWASLVTRFAGAVALLVVGVVHLQAYGGPYSAVPTIGVLFLVNFAAATAIGGTLLGPLERLAGRWGGTVLALATVGGIGLAAGSLAMLIVAEHGTLFEFHEPGYDPEAISRSRVAEIASVILLTASLALRWPAKTRPRW
jgi:hypothetical protein